MFEANDGDGVEGSEVLRRGVHCAVYRLAHIAVQSKGTQVPAEEIEAGPQREPRLPRGSEFLGDAMLDLIFDQMKQ